MRVPLTNKRIDFIIAGEDAENNKNVIVVEIKKDKHLTGVMCEVRKSEVVWNLISLYREGAITLDDLDGFSDKLVERIKIAVE